MPPEELRLLVIASTYPANAGDGTPGFVRDLAAGEARHLTTVVLVPRVPGAPSAERDGALEVRRFRYFPSRWEDLAEGAILENLRRRPSRWLQVIPFLICQAIAVRRMIRRFQPHVLHVHWLLPQGVIARLVANGTPRLLTLHGGDLYALNGRLPRMLKRWALRDASAITVMNADMRQRVDELGSGSGTARVLPMGAAVADLRAAMAGVERVRGRLLFAGRLVEKKGVAVLLRALAKLDPEVPWSLEVVGDGPLRGGLEAASAPLGDRVRFRGTLDRERLAKAMAASEIIVLPSVPAASGDQDGRPVVLVEGMAAGCAIVASRLPGLDEAIVDEVNGLLVPPGDADALAVAISRLLL
ncbi:MAG: glycosyltransferase, partial [Nitriliruptorales bacterium]|nr:glycosyltransferase [Nitriliruptorales bacterium]